MKKFKNIVTNVGTYLGITILVVWAALMAFGIRTFITMSGSMEPKIQTGSLCFVNTNASFESIQEGDIIAFEAPSGALVTHRVIGKEENGRVLVTKGDNNDIEDGPTTTAKNFRGETLFSIPYAGYALATLQKPQYKMMTMIVMIALVLLIGIDFFADRK